MSKRTRRKWYQRKVCEDEELDHLLAEDSCLTQEKKKMGVLPRKIQ